MLSTRFFGSGIAAACLVLCALPVAAQSFKVQCPTATPSHPSDPADAAANPAGGRIKCQQISGGDGFATMGDGTQTYLFGFGPLSGLKKMASGLPGTDVQSEFNVDNTSGVDPIFIGAPVDQSNLDVSAYSFNGAIGLVPDPQSEPTPGALTGHVDPRLIMDVGVMNANQPAPLMAIDEDDEFFLTLTNVGQVMRPDLFEQHTVHFHGYPNASAFYDGVPDASVAINIGASFTYYYLSPDAGTYFWHCHITPPEHLQMGMVGQLFVRPRQDRVAAGGGLYSARQQQDLDLRTACVSANDILCSNPLPATANTVSRAVTGRYAYNDGDGSTFYNVDYPLQIHGFDPNFHFVGMTFNPEGFADMKDKYFLLNGRSYPDTVTPGPLQTQSADGVNHFSQPLPAIIKITPGQRALLRISDLDVSEYQTLASLGIPMQVIGYNAKLLRDEAGNNLYYTTNSITLGGGESLDVILDTCAVRPTVGAVAGAPPDYTTCTTPLPTGTYYLYTPNLDHLSNDAENFGGLMTEVRVN